MAPHSRPVGSDDKENQTDASSNLTEIFSDNGSDTDSISDPELDSEDSDDEDEDEPDDDISDDEGQLPPEHYLAQAESLKVSALTEAVQRHHSGKTRWDPHLLE